MFTAKKRENLLTMPDFTSPPFKSSFVLQKNSPLTVIVKDITNRMTEYGIVSYLNRKYDISRSTQTTEPKVNHALTMQQLWYSIATCVGFYFLAMIYLFAEILWYRENEQGITLLLEYSRSTSYV